MKVPGLVVTTYGNHSGHFQEIAATPPKHPNRDGTVAKFTYNDLILVCTKFHAFTIKCTILSYIRWTTFSPTG